MGIVTWDVSRLVMGNPHFSPVWQVTSGKPTVPYGKSPSLRGKSTIFYVPFSIAM
jgi:hypothetical protein